MRALASLGSLSFAVQAALDPDALVQALSEHVLDLAGADQFMLLLLDDDSGELEGHSFERDLAGARRVRLAPDPNGFVGQVLRRETLVVDDPSKTSPVGRDELGWSGAAPATIVGLPVLVGTSLLGVAALGYRRPRPMTDRRRRTLLFLADQVGLAVDRIRTRADLDAATRRLDEARAALQRSDQSKSELISIVSHEMRTPLTAIKAYTESLLDNIDQPSFAMQQKFLSVINEECDRLARMVNDVLDLSRLDSGHRRLRAEPLTIRAVVADVLPTVEPALQEKLLAFRLELPADLPRVEADLDLLKQIFVNLIHNAAKFSPAEQEIIVRAERAGDRLRIAVEDHGRGIPPDHLPRVFERFYRVEGNGERVGGTGLGLAIVKSAVELHGGTIAAESEVGAGTRFVFELPLAQSGIEKLVRSLEPLFVQPELRAVLQQCVEMVAEVMEAKIVSFMFLDAAGLELRIQASYGLDADTAARTHVRIGDSIAGWVAQTSEPLLVRDVETDRRFQKMNHPQYETRSLLCVPLQLSGVTIGVVNANNKVGGSPFDEDDLRLLSAIVSRVAAALDRLNAAPNEADIAATLASLRAVVRARRLRTLPSTQRAFKLATELGRRLSLPTDEIDVLGYVARVHDVGMLAVDEERLSSPRAWDEREHREVEAHPQSAVRMLRPLEFAAKVNEIILAHHEHMDGRGYPRGLRGEQIPLAARIVSVVDAFESLTVGRPYRDPVSDEEALAELKRGAGTQFDPVVVDGLVAIVRERSAERASGAGADSTIPPSGPVPTPRPAQAGGAT
ncbi:MAG TPA: HD domain-containing phosphohydrolase [Candidatus Eisenbacteria bacterium]|nr:HD domain-containing phosphohydrolase [Candidatus Eisenbacteria bacterium]